LERAGQAYRKKVVQLELKEAQREDVGESEGDAATIERALVPVKRFSSRIILPDVAHSNQVRETVRLVNLKHQITWSCHGSAS
jgi:hypothetical protein